MRKIFTWIISILFCSVIAIAAREVVTDILSLKASSLPSTCQNGQVRFDTSTNILNKCLSNAWKPVVETTTAQTLSSKTFSDAPILAEIATPSTPSSGYGKTYFKSDGKLYTLNDAGTETEVGAGGASGINYIDNPSAESDTSGWATYADAAGTSPVDGTAGSPTTTWTRSTSSPLRDTGSFLLTKDASNRQGEGASFDFTIDASDKGKVIQGSLEYAVSSGTFADDDVSIWIYDVTNTTLIQPTPYELKNHSLPSERFPFEFQSAIDSTSYRLIIHVASTSAVAYVLKFDNFSVGPGAKLYGSPITDWVSFTPTGSWVTNTTYTGKWRRVGDSMEVQAQVALAGAPTATALTFNLPPGYSIDTNKINSTTYQHVLGFGKVNDSSSFIYHVSVRYLSSTAVAVINLGAAGTFLNDPSSVDQVTPMTFGNADYVNINYSVPILGWSSSQIMSHDADTRVVAAKYQTNAGQSIGSGSANVINFEDLVLDTHNAVTVGASWVYTVKVPGNYVVSACALYNSASFTANTVPDLSAFVNGSSKGRLAHAGIGATATQYVSLNGSIILENLVANDTIDLRIGHGEGSARSLESTAINNTVSIFRLSGPSQIMASETVAARYTTNAGNSVSTSTLTFLDFEDKDYDTHGMVSGTGSGNVTTTNTGWKATVPISGLYSIAAAVMLDVTSPSGFNGVGEQIYLLVYVDGVQKGYLIIRRPYSGEESPHVRGSITLKILAGQRVELVMNQASGGSLPIHTNSILNYIEINRVGNY